MTDTPRPEPGDVRALTVAAEEVCNFAWSAVTADCEESRQHLNGLIGNLRAALARSPSPDHAADATCPKCHGAGAIPGGVIRDAAGGQMDYVEDEECPICKGTGAIDALRATPASTALTEEERKLVEIVQWQVEGRNPALIGSGGATWKQATGLLAIITRLLGDGKGETK